MKIADVAVYMGDDGRWYRQAFTDRAITGARETR